MECKKRRREKEGKSDDSWIYTGYLKPRPRHPRGNTQGEYLTGNVFSGALDDRDLNKVTKRENRH